MLKFANAAVMGDVIRAYDFKPMAGRNDCYVEGVVLEQFSSEKGFDSFKIRCTKDVFDGEVQVKDEHSRLGRIIYVPHEVSFMEYNARIINLSK